MIEYIAEIGGKVVRMGDIAVPDIQANIPLVNYPKSDFKSEWMDIFLLSQCKYFIGCNSGPICTAVLFEKPIIHTNCVTWHISNCLNGDIYLPKKFRSKETGTFLSVKQYVQQNFHLILELLGEYEAIPSEPYEAIPNDGVDLINAVKEMEQYLENGLPEIDPLQSRWRESFPWKEEVFQGARISLSFVKRHRKELFEE